MATNAAEIQEEALNEATLEQLVDAFNLLDGGFVLTRVRQARRAARDGSTVACMGLLDEVLEILEPGKGHLS